MWGPFVADGSPFLHAQDAQLKAVSKEIDQIISYIQLLLHNHGKFADVLKFCVCEDLDSQNLWIAVWLDMHHDILRLAMIDLDRNINLALVYHNGNKKIW